MVSPANQNKLSALEASRLGARLFRYQVGLAWVGEIIAKTTEMIVLKNPRPFKAGVVGVSDSIGFTPVKITTEMVGQTVAVFLAVEDKGGKGRRTKEQADFITLVRSFGGRAGVARNDDDVAAIVRGEIRD